jgi:hypothetical protein
MAGGLAGWRMDSACRNLDMGVNLSEFGSEMGRLPDLERTIPPNRLRLQPRGYGVIVGEQSPLAWEVFDAAFYNEACVALLRGDSRHVLVQKGTPTTARTGTGTETGMGAGAASPQAKVRGT